MFDKRNELTSNMTTLFACAYGVTSRSLHIFQEHVAFQLVTVIFLWPAAGSSPLFSKVQDKY